MAFCQRKLYAVSISPKVLLFWLKGMILHLGWW